MANNDIGPLAPVAPSLAQLRAGTAALQSSGSVAPGVFNFKHSNTKKWRAARAKVQAGVSNAKVLGIFNSIGAGRVDSTGAGLQNNTASTSWPTRLAQMMNSASLPVSWQSWIGGQNEASFNLHDFRIGMGGWTNNGAGGLGNNVLLGATAGAASTACTFTPLTSVDTADYLYVKNGGVLLTSVDGGATISTITQTISGLTYGKSTVALGSLASHSIEAKRSSGNATLAGIIAYNSAIKEVQILRAGWSGAVVSNLWTGVGGAFKPMDGVSVIAPDLTIIGLTRNDASAGNDVAVFKSSYQTIIDTALLSGDVFIMIEPMGSLSAATYAPYVTALYELAVANDLVVIDFTSPMLWTPFDATWYGDNIHPTVSAYPNVAAPMSKLLLAA